MKGYIDLYLIPLPEKNKAEYKKQATTFGKMAMAYGALDYREFTGDDLTPKGTQPFTKAQPLKSGEILISSVVSFKSRKHRDSVMKKMFSDPKMGEMMKETPLFDTKRMLYGGFETLVSF